MKLTAILIFIASLHVSAKAHAQEKVSLTIKNGSLETVLKEISKQTGYLYVFQDQWKEKAKKIDISVANVPLEEALAICFKDQPFTYTIIKRTIVVKEREGIPQITGGTPTSAPMDIHGRVLDENNQPVFGVTVTIKGTKRATSTDDNGEFSFKQTDKDAILVFTSVNMETFELKVNGDNDLSVKLRTKTKQLGEVAIELNTGYQRLPKERATGSFDFIDNNTINQQVGSNIINRIDGVASGVIFPKQNLQGAPAFMVRGLSTINSPNSPLIVVDNFPYDGDINNINPNDIESITILKDAASASIWGARAGNGVVVITTKKGRFNQSLHVDLSSNAIETKRPSLNNLNIISSGDYINVEKQLFANGYYDGYLSDTYNYPAVSPVVQILNNEKNGAISAAEANTQINAYLNNDIRQQYSKYMYQQAVTQQYALNLYGGNSNLTYYLSGGYDKSIDNLDAPSNRLSIRSTNVYKPVKNLQVSVGVQYTQSTSQSGKPDYGSIKSGQWGVPYLQFADAKGNPLPIAQYLSKSYTDTAGAGKLLDWNYYPLEDYKHSVTTINQQDLLANIGISYQVKGGLSFDVKYLFERQTSRTNNLNDNQSYYTRDLINTFSQIDPNIGAVTYIVPNGGILNVSNSLLESQDVRGQTNYSHTYGKHDLVLLAGGEIRQAHNTGINTTYYGYDPNTLLTSNVDLVNYYPSYINGGTTNIPSNNLLTDRLNRYVSVYANGAYTYDNKYTISASGRRDASNLFGVNTNNKWKPLWSVGASWALSNESFYHVEWLPYLKLRATYGYTGNTDPFSTGILTVFYVNPQPPSNLPWTKINALLNPDLRWEQVKTINVGLDFRTLHDRIYGTIEGYIKNGLNLIGATAFDPSAGLNDQNTISKNVASMNGKGIDVTLNAKIFDHAFKWNTTILFSYNSSKTSKYYLDSNLLSSSFVGPGTIINPIPGQPLYSIGAYKWAGLDSQGNPQGYIDKKASTDYYTLTQLSKKEDLIYKPVMPVYFGSFINTFSWKELTLSINIVYRFRYYFMKPTLSYSSLFSGGATVGSGDYLKRWQKQGDEGITNVPSAIYPADQNRDLFYSYSMINVDKGDNIKIQYINLSYDFSKIVKKVNFSHLQLFLNSSNWGMIWKANKDGIDPDYIGAPKIGKTYAIGIKTGF